MNIQELIEHLQIFPPETTVVISYTYCGELEDSGELAKSSDVYINDKGQLHIGV